MTQTPEITADAVGPSDAELITAVRSGDQEAFGELFARHQAAARGLARQLVRDPNEADDLVSESFAKILQVLRGGGGPDAAFRAYLYTTVRRVAYDRTKAVNRVRPTDDLTPYDAGVPFVDPALEGLEKTLVASAFRTLPERWQAVLWHTEVEGFRLRQVGALLGLTAERRLRPGVPGPRGPAAGVPPAAPRRRGARTVRGDPRQARRLRPRRPLTPGDRPGRRAPRGLREVSGPRPRAH